MSESETTVNVMLVVFQAGGSCMAIDSRAVVDIVRVPQITAVHNAPPCVLGIANLRGRIITIVDLEARLGFPLTKAVDPRLLIVEDRMGEAIGVYVPVLMDVVEASPDDIQPIEAGGHSGKLDCAIGVFRRDPVLASVLDPERFLLAKDA